MFMKRKLLLLFLFLVLSTAVGCGRNKTETQKVMPTATPAPVLLSVTPVPEDAQVDAPVDGVDDDLVEMQVIPGRDVENSIGQKTASSKEIIVENQTGDEIGEFYVRVHPEDEDEDDEEWGWDLIAGGFTVENGGKLAYYLQPDAESTSEDTRYDIQIGYTDEDLTECYFRNLPLETISSIVLRMHGTGDEAYPYCTYLTATGSKEYSTLEEVRRRLGLSGEETDEEDDDEEDDDEDEDSSDEEEETAIEENKAEEAEAGSSTEETQDNTSSSDNTVTEEIDTGEIEGDSYADTEDSSTARNYIGQSLAALESAVGSPNGSDYQDLVELGKTGYHYYSSFTVSTAVDENGNEIVTGVW